MRVTKKILAKAINDWFDKVEIPYEVNPVNIVPTRFTPDQIEGGATRHYITAQHKTDEDYLDLPIYTMGTLGQMSYELNKFEGTRLKLKDYGKSRHVMELWVIVG